MTSFEGFTMLTVDDEEDLCQYTKSFFERRKCKVFIASDECSALEIAMREHPSIILLDVLLGDTNGIELLRKIRKENISSPVIMLSGHLPDESTKQLLHELNVFDYIQKPVILDKLEEVVKSALASQNK